ncbi:uncharacterized protein EURHEDRAFT_381764 [Aspergillus ruber CBS 135680]|uniref:Uncharacterized protein n=1 Tax=Aspergillus ruber (strain CBS 135680) TaxID=1388766 RepID=A0A017S1G3_ASPRC|nr:uncharacterized protein EURHEDRAFT_381764 [Aspergillus ruber CBS 135680]EYE90661.1 hypothetical protein EURHEDRAFT_381764 [Aspergillus ruber CBS 135680]
MATSPVVSPWVQIKAQLDGDPGNWATKRYLRAVGGEVSRVLGGYAERLDAATSSGPRQETLSAVYHVIAGSGRSKVGGLGEGKSEDVVKCSFDCC